MNNIQVLLFSLVSLVLFFSCKSDLSNSEVLEEHVIDQIISGHMPASIKVADAIRVRFVEPVVEENQIGQEVDAAVFHLQPKVTGSAVWEDAFTFRFMPDPYFEPSTEYVLQLNTELVLKDSPTDLKRLNFTFQTLPIDFEIVFDEVKPSEKEGSHMLTGEISLGIPMDQRKIEQVLSVDYRLSNTKVTWEHPEKGSVHRFIITDISRGDKAEVLKLRWDGRSVQAKEKGEHQVEIPALHDFKVIGFDVSQSGGKKVTIHFSDPLDKGQMLDGLVRIQEFKDQLRTEVDGNELTIYPGEKLKGNFLLVLDPSIRTISDKTLGEVNRFQLSFEDIHPQLRLLGRGVIVPHSEDVIFPFEAINVKGVTLEVVEIFQNNVLQFLQYQEMDQSWGIDPVGRIVAQENIDLEVTENDRNTWKYFGLDLSKYTNMAPGSIFQVRLAFQKNQALIACNDVKVDQEEFHASGDILETIMQYHYDYPGFTYGHADDPCYPAYYNPERFVQRNVIASNLGMIVKKGKGETMSIHVHDLRTTKPLSGVDLSVYDFQQQLISSSSTNANGYSQLTCARKPFFVIADRNGEKGYLKLSDATSRPMSDFDVAGVQPSKGLKGFIYTERDVWRPGDTVFLNFILQDEINESISHPVTCTLINPRGQRVYNNTKSESTGPIYPFQFDTDQSDITGNWRAEVRVGGASFNKMLRVETIQPNRLKIVIDVDEAISAYQTKPDLNLESSWLHGTPAAGLKAKMEMQLLRHGSWPGTKSGYVFLDPTRMVDSRVTTIFEDFLNDEGKAEVPLKDIQLSYLPGPMISAFKTRVFEPGGNFSSDSYRVPFYPFDSYVGIKLPTSRWGSKAMDVDRESQVDITTIDEKGVPIGSRKVTVGLYQSEWRWWWDRTDRSLAQFNSSVHTGAYFMDTLVTDQNGQAHVLIQPESYGLYLIRVCDIESGHCSGDFYYAGELWNEYEGKNAAVKLVFSADQESYAIGNRGTIHIPSSSGSAILVSLENHEGVLQSEQIQATGENTQFQFEITKEMQPNVYAHVSLIQPHNSRMNDLPMRMYGVLPITVIDPDTKLEPLIEMPDVLRPEEEFRIKITERENKPMAYTIAVVDEGLLDLTRFKTPDPDKYFNAKEALGLHTWDVYDYVLGNYGGKVSRIISVGGDAAVAEVQAVEEVNRFKPVVIHLGPFLLEPGKESVHTLKMPNYVGSVRTMVVAADEGRYGASEMTTQVKKPLMLLATAPRVLSPGEQFTLPVHVFAMEDDVRKVTVNCAVNESLEIIGRSEKTVSFSGPGDQIVPFEVLVKDQLGIGKLQIDGTGGRHNSSTQIEFEILNPNPNVSEVKDFQLEPGQQEVFEVPAIGMEGTQEAIVELYGILPFNLEKRLRFLVQYPYGCLEQTTSAALPQLYVGSLIELSNEQSGRVRSNIQAAIRKIRKFYRQGGGYSYWPGGQYVNHWTNSYVGHFLLEAKEAGYFVDQDLLDHWYEFQKSTAIRFDHPQENAQATYHAHLDQAYRLYTLAKFGRAEFGSMNRMLNVKDLSGPAKALLAAAYGAAGQTNPAEELIQDITTNIQSYTSNGYTYGSDLRDRALLVEAYLALDKRTEAASVVRRISEDLGKNKWYSTQSTGFGLKAIADFTNTQTGDGLHFSFTQGDGARLVVQEEKPVFQIALEHAGNGRYEFQIDNLGGSELFARVITRGQPLEPSDEKKQSHLKLDVSYYSMNGKKLDVAQIQQGTDFVAEVKIINPGTLTNEIDELALQQVFPSGWEIINQRMDRFAEALANDSYDFQDVRDDRVYTFFDLDRTYHKTYRIGLNAAYVGRFLLPGVQCEAMYDHSISAFVPGKWIEVIPERQEVVSNQ